MTPSPSFKIRPKSANCNIWTRTDRYIHVSSVVAHFVDSSGCNQRPLVHDCRGSNGRYWAAIKLRSRLVRLQWYVIRLGVQAQAAPPPIPSHGSGCRFSSSQFRLNISGSVLIHRLDAPAGLRVAVEHLRIGSVRAAQSS
jgi:hypothetical protein